MWGAKTHVIVILRRHGNVTIDLNAEENSDINQMIDKNSVSIENLYGHEKFSTLPSINEDL